MIYWVLNNTAPLIVTPPTACVTGLTNDGLSEKTMVRRMVKL